MKTTMKNKMERGREVVSTGRDNSDLKVGAPKTVNDSNKSREPGYSMGKSLGGMGKGSLTKGY